MVLSPAERSQRRCRLPPPQLRRATSRATARPAPERLVATRCLYPSDPAAADYRGRAFRRIVAQRRGGVPAEPAEVIRELVHLLARPVQVMYVRPTTRLLFCRTYQPTGSSNLRILPVVLLRSTAHEQAHYDVVASRAPRTVYVPPPAGPAPGCHPPCPRAAPSARHRPLRRGCPCRRRAPCRCLRLPGLHSHTEDRRL